MICPKCGAQISKLQCDNCGFVFKRDTFTFLNNRNRQEMRALADYIHSLTEPESMEVRIGKRVTQNLSQEELAEFDSITDKTELAQWLEKHVPNYHQIVDEERARENTPLSENPSATSQTPPPTSNVYSNLPDKDVEAQQRDAEDLTGQRGDAEGDTQLFDTRALEELTGQRRAAEAVAQLIDRIPSFSYTDSFRLELMRVRAAYDALSPMAQLWVSNYERLTTEERRFAELANSVPPMPEAPKPNNGQTTRNNSDDESVEAINEILRMRDENADRARDDRAAAERVSHLIGQIGIGNVTLTDECAQRIHDARWAYNALTVQQRSLVDHYSWLTNAETEYRNLQSEAERKAQKHKSIIRTISVFAVLAVIGIVVGYFGLSHKLANNSKSAQPQSISITDEGQGTSALAAARRGDRFLFGRYEQDNNTENGYENLEWVVLSNDAGMVTATTLYCIDDKAYNEGTAGEETSWETCTLRKWLNEEFYSTAFTDSERSKIQSLKLSTPDMTADEDPGGSITTEYVSLLSCSDIIQLYPKYEFKVVSFSWEEDDSAQLTTTMSSGSAEELVAYYTEYARARHLQNYEGTRSAETYVTVTEVEDGANVSAWWLRNMGNKSYTAMQILWNGSSSSVPAHAYVGVRPVIRLNCQ